MANTKYADDALVMNRSTTLADIQGFLRERLRDPIILEDDSSNTDIIIWDLSSHPPDMDALEKVQNRLHRGEYLIPYNIGPVFGMIMPMLPDSLKEVEILRYDVEDEIYTPHHNYYRDLSTENVRGFREELREIQHKTLQNL